MKLKTKTRKIKNNKYEALLCQGRYNEIYPHFFCTKDEAQTRAIEWAKAMAKNSDSPVVFINDDIVVVNF